MTEPDPYRYDTRCDDCGGAIPCSCPPDNHEETEEETMPSYKSAFGSYLKQEDLQGRAVKAVIASVGHDDVKDTDSGKTEKKLIMHFVGKDKTLILNRTNCESLEAITGTDDYGAWAGHAVVLFSDPTVMFGGKRTGGLRIRAVAHGTTTPPPPPVREPGEDDDEEIPFAWLLPLIMPLTAAALVGVGLLA